MIDIVFTSILTVVLLLITVLLLVLLITVLIINKKNNSPKLNKVKKIVFSLSKVIEDEKTSVMDINNKNISLFKIIDGLNNLSSLKHLQEIIIDIDNTKLSKTQVEELMPVFEKLNKKYKVKAMASHLDNDSYKIALLADNIYLFKSLSSNLSLHGYFQRHSYFKSFLTKLGIKMNVIHIGDFKASGENFNRDTMSEEKKTSIIKIQEGSFQDFCDLIRDRRHTDIREHLISGELLFTSYIKAKETGLIDDVYEIDEKTFDFENDAMLFTTFLKKCKTKKNKAKNIIGVISLEGNISSKKQDNTISYKEVKEKLEQLKEIKNLKGLVLKVNSPGGSALESEMIYQALKKVNVPIYVSMSDICASGGYYISMAAKKIFANKSTITGSIGVVAMYPEFSKLVEKLSINQEVIKNFDENIDVFSPLSDSLKEKLITSMNMTYGEFKKHVIEARKINANIIEDIAQGRIYLAKDAKNNNLIDEIGNFEDCLHALTTDLNLKDYKVAYLKNEKSYNFNLNTITNLLKEDTTILDEVLKNKISIMMYEDYTH